MSWSPDDSYTDDRVLQKVAKFLLFQVEPFGLRRLYWEFLDHPERCGLLYNERAKCYTRIVNYWLLFLEAYPGSKRPDSEVHRACHTIVLHRWSRLLHKCVPGDKDLICRLRDFTLHKARKEDVERVVAWLEVRFHIYRSWFYVLYLSDCFCRWTQIYRKMSSFAGKPTTWNNIHCLPTKLHQYQG